MLTIKKNKNKDKQTRLSGGSTLLPFITEK